MLWKCPDCGIERECDTLARDDWHNGDLGAIGPDCPECDCPMDAVSDDQPPLEEDLEGFNPNRFPEE